MFSSTRRPEGSSSRSIGTKTGQSVPASFPSWEAIRPRSRGASRTEKVPRSTVCDTRAIAGPMCPQSFRDVDGAQGRNRTTDTGIFSLLKPVEKSEVLSGDVRQALFKARQGRYAEARSCTVRPQNIARYRSHCFFRSLMKSTNRSSARILAKFGSFAKCG